MVAEADRKGDEKMNVTREGLANRNTYQRSRVGARKKDFLKMVTLHQSTTWRGRGNSRSGQAKTQRCEMPVVGIKDRA